MLIRLCSGDTLSVQQANYKVTGFEEMFNKKERSITIKRNQDVLQIEVDYPAVIKNNSILI